MILSCLPSTRTRQGNLTPVLAFMAQLVEHSFSKRKVPGSIPGGGISFFLPWLHDGAALCLMCWAAQMVGTAPYHQACHPGGLYVRSG